MKKILLTLAACLGLVLMSSAQSQSDAVQRARAEAARQRNIARFQRNTAGKWQRGNSGEAHERAMNNQENNLDRWQTRRQRNHGMSDAVRRSRAEAMRQHNIALRNRQHNIDTLHQRRNDWNRKHKAHNWHNGDRDNYGDRG